MVRIDSIVALVTASFSAVRASSVGNQYVVHERRHALSDAWSKVGVAPEKDIIPMRIGLAQSNLEHGDKLLKEVQDEIIDLFSPEPGTIAKVKSWLVDEEIGKLNRLFKTEYTLYKHEPSSEELIACDEYSVPVGIETSIDFIKPGVMLQTRKSRKRHTQMVHEHPEHPIPGKHVPIQPDYPQILQEPESKKCGKMITPDCIRALYDFKEGTTKSPGNELGVYTNEYYYQQIDLNTFFSKFFPKIPNGTHPELESIDGATGSPHNKYFVSSEADLDFESAYPIIWPQTAKVIQVADATLGIFNTWLDAIDGSYCTYKKFGIKGDTPGIDPKYPQHRKKGYKGQLECGKYKPQNVMTVSYGEQGEYYLPLNYQRRQCSEFMKLGMQGVTVLTASGDSGVSDFGVCLFRHKDNHIHGSVSAPVFNPGNLQSCPYVTVVGATQFPEGADIKNNGEIAVRQPGFRSGSGFSNIFATPSWQKSAVDSYFESVDLPFHGYHTHLNKSLAADGGVFNRAGRAYPDVAAIGENITVAYRVALSMNGGITLFGGTSASSPIFAALLTRINEERLGAGKNTIGFVNPTLYANPNMFNDITKGNSAACNSSGFVAAPGWDPVTGLGTPKYPEMLKVFMDLP